MGWEEVGTIFWCSDRGMAEGCQGEGVEWEREMETGSGNHFVML